MSDDRGGEHIMVALPIRPARRNLPDPLPCPPWCGYEECHVESLLEGDGEIAYADFGLTAEQCHSSEPFSLKPEQLPELDGWWPWPRPRDVHINVVKVEGWFLDRHVETVGPAVVIEAGDEEISLDPVSAMRIGAALIRAGREARRGVR